MSIHYTPTSKIQRSNPMAVHCLIYSSNHSFSSRHASLLLAKHYNYEGNRTESYIQSRHSTTHKYMYDPAASVLSKWGIFVTHSWLLDSGVILLIFNFGFDFNNEFSGFKFWIELIKIIKINLIKMSDEHTSKISHAKLPLPIFHA